MPLTRFEYYPANLVEKIFWGRVEIMAATAFMYFTSGSVVQHSLHLLKYKGKKEIGIYFGRKMGEHLKQSQRFQNCEIIIPLPLFADREKKRGYNQSAMIAAGIALQLDIPVIPDAVIRTKKTATQTHKSRIERWENMRLVDDVVTTGASLEACALTLLSLPGTTVSIACLAHTVSA